LESVQQDGAISKCGHLECHDTAKCKRHWKYFEKCKRRVCYQTLLFLWGVLKACGSVVGLEEGRSVNEQIIQSGLEYDVF
jgi:hypothetical protein